MIQWNIDFFPQTTEGSKLRTKCVSQLYIMVIHYVSIHSSISTLSWNAWCNWNMNLQHLTVLFIILGNMQNMRLTLETKMVFTLGLCWKFCKIWRRSPWDVGPYRYGLQWIQQSMTDCTQCIEISKMTVNGITAAKSVVPFFHIRIE